MVFELCWGEDWVEMEDKETFVVRRGFDVKTSINIEPHESRAWIQVFRTKTAAFWRPKILRNHSACALIRAQGFLMHAKPY